VEALARGIEVVKANQRELLDLLTLLLKNSAPPQPDLPSITELFQLPMKTIQDARNLTKLLKVQHNASKMVNFKHSSNNNDLNFIFILVIAEDVRHWDRRDYEFHGWKGHEVNHDLPVWQLFLLSRPE
jgi:hypothetical protein